MSAINVFRQRDAIHCVNDTAVCDKNGELVFFRPKAMALPLLPAVIATRGSSRSLDLLGTALSGNYRTFDDLVDGIEDFFPRIIDFHLADLGDMRTELFLGGWSARNDAFATYQIISEDNRPFGMDAMTLYPMTDIDIGPPVDEKAMLHARDFGPRLNNVEDIDPERHGLMFLELQRQQLSEFGGVPAHWIGGEALLTTVTREGVTQRVIHRWDDQPGEMITPSPVDWKQWWADRTPKFEAPAGASRLRREMAERRARKLAA